MATEEEEILQALEDVESGRLPTADFVARVKSSDSYKASPSSYSDLLLGLIWVKTSQVK